MTPGRPIPYSCISGILRVLRNGSHPNLVLGIMYIMFHRRPVHSSLPPAVDLLLKQQLTIANFSLENLEISPSLWNVMHLLYFTLKLHLHKLLCNLYYFNALPFPDKSVEKFIDQNSMFPKVNVHFENDEMQMIEFISTFMFFSFFMDFLSHFYMCNLKMQVSSWWLKTLKVK